MSKTTVSLELRQFVAENSRYRCCYCLTQEEIVGTYFTVDHIIPEALGGQTTLENLCLACWDCNLIKQKRISGIDAMTNEMIALFHPNRQHWHAHFAWQQEGCLIIGLTPTGRATIETLRLNRPVLVQARKRWIQAGWHPPQD